MRHCIVFATVFPSAISAVVLGICEGALRTAIEYQKDRAGMLGKTSDDPYMMAAMVKHPPKFAHRSSLCSTTWLKCMISSKLVKKFTKCALMVGVISPRCMRAVRAVNELFTRTGGNALRTDMPMHRFWRDANAGLNHAVFTTGPILSCLCGTLNGFCP